MTSAKTSEEDITSGFKLMASFLRPNQENPSLEVEAPVGTFVELGAGLGGAVGLVPVPEVEVEEDVELLPLELELDPDPDPEPLDPELEFELEPLELDPDPEPLELELEEWYEVVFLVLRVACLASSPSICAIIFAGTGSTLSSSAFLPTFT